MGGLKLSKKPGISACFKIQTFQMIHSPPAGGEFFLRFASQIINFEDSKSSNLRMTNHQIDRDTMHRTKKLETSHEKQASV